MDGQVTSSPGVEPLAALARADSSAPRFPIVLLLFVASGATGLVDQLCFSKYLSYVVGSTAYAVSAVLAAFMTGLAIGAHWGGRLSARITRPLRAYGVVEMVVAAAVATTPLAFRALTPLYAALARSMPGSLVALSGLRWLLALCLVVVPTMAMGATLPLLTRSVDDGDPSPAATALREKRLSALYSINTLGGALGALAAAYVILPALGMDGTIWASAAVSATIAVIALTLGARDALSPLTASPSADARREALERAELARLYVLAFASGCLVFAAEVVFTHLLALIIGNSAYAFGLILAAFLVCLAFGAASAGRVNRLGSTSLALGLALSGLALCGTLPVWDKLPYFFNNTGEVIQSFAAREATRGLAAFVMLCVPTTLMGLTFPLLLLRIARYAEVGRWVGRLTAVNTLGAVCGSLATGYLLLPWLGSQRSLIAIALGFVLAGVAALSSSAVRGRTFYLLTAGLSCLVAWLCPRWDLALLTSGTNVYFEGYHPPKTLLMVREDVHGGVTTVTQGADAVLTLYTNGKFQGNTGWEMNAQRFFAHYPSLFVKNYDDLLVIGLGTGTTLGTLAGYPWKRISVAEISPSILEAARTYFRGPNLGAIDDPRVTIHHADGRNYLLVSESRYDLISMELSSIWFAGASSLYSREFYALVHQRMKPGGVFQQWVQLHHVERRTFATILNTLRREFAHVTLFYGGNQGILVASDAPLVASRSRIEALQQTAEVAATVPRARPLLELIDDAVLIDDGLDQFLADSAREAGEPVDAMISTDGNLYLEYATPRGNVLPWVEREKLVATLREFRDPEAVANMIGP
ncbi:MAG TPA: fused MFS/spermidine synthase [Polyangiaceae bacterium]